MREFLVSRLCLILSIYYSGNTETDTEIEATIEQIRENILKELFTSIEDDLINGNPILVNQQFDVFNDMLTEKSDELDMYIPELSRSTFGRRIEAWIKSDDCVKKGFQSRTTSGNAKMYGTMLFMETWDPLDMLHRNLAAESSTPEDDDDQQFSLFNESRSEPSPLEMHSCLKLLRKRLKTQKALCEIYRE